MTKPATTIRTAV